MKKMKEMDMPIDVTCTCPMCGKEHFVVVDFDDLLLWRNGELIQNAFPYLSTTEREQLISELCPECQKKIFTEF